MNQDYVLYYMLFAILIYIVWKAIPFIKNARKVSKAVFSKIHINSRSTLSDEECKKLSVGAILSEQQVAFINSLTTGLDVTSMKESLSQSWGINNNKEAVDTLNYLVDGGHRVIFDVVYNAFLLDSKQQQNNLISSKIDETASDYEENVHKAFDQLQNLIDTWSELTKNNVVKTTEDLKKYNNKAWDYGRLAQISRLCYDCGYISEEKAWEFINKAFKMTLEDFDSWESFSKSYIIGRAMWGGLEYYTDRLNTIATYLLNNEKSPWKQFPLK